MSFPYTEITDGNQVPFDILICHKEQEWMIVDFHGTTEAGLLRNLLIHRYFHHLEK